MRKSLMISLVAIFGALHAVLYVLSFPWVSWRNWAIYIEALEGVILGPLAGFAAALLGSLMGRMIIFDPLWIFGVIAEPVSVLTAGFISRGKWKPAVIIYLALMLGYFAHPFGRMLPLWTILDVLAAFVLIYPAAKLSNGLNSANVKRLSISLVLLSFVATAVDSLVRIFLLIPAGLYSVFADVFGTFEKLQAIFTVAAVSSYIEDLQVIIVTLIVGTPLMIALSKSRLFEREEKPKESNISPDALIESE